MVMLHLKYVGIYNSYLGVPPVFRLETGLLRFACGPKVVGNVFRLWRVLGVLVWSGSEESDVPYRLVYPAGCFTSVVRIYLTMYIYIYMYTTRSERATLL